MEAYSAGSYLDHSPPALLKSGIPDSTDMPAPVSASVSLEFIMISVFLNLIVRGRNYTIKLN